MRTRTLNSYALALEYGRTLLVDLDDGQMVAQPLGGVNRPAWIVGHLIYSCQMIGVEMGLSPWLPGDWEQRFVAGSPVAADTGRYPGRDELLAMFSDATDRVRERLIQMTDAELDAALPDERYRDVFPTLGHAVLHVLTVHTAIHLGQLSAWRRAMGLP